MKCIERVVDEPIPWEKFKVAFLDCFFPIELRAKKIMSMMKYFVKFNKLSKFALYLIVDP